MYRRILFLLIAVIFLSFPAAAEEGQNIDTHTTKLPYTLTADGEISYDNVNGVLQAVENARFEIDDMMISADKIAVFYKKEIVQAEGDQLVIKIGEQVYKGSSLEYNYNTKTGTISGVSSRINDLSFSGKNIALTKDNEYEMDDVELTPCIFPEPHYSIKAKSVKVYPDDKIVARSVWAYFAGHRVFYLPVYTIEFDEDSDSYDRVSFLPSISYNTTDGIIMEVDYPYEISDNFQGRINGKTSQYGDNYFEMNNTYNINSQLDLINSYVYQDEEDDGEIKKTNELGGGLRYRNHGFHMTSLYKWDYLNRQNIIEVDTKYRYQRYEFGYFNKFTENDLTNEIYSIKYNSSIPIKLLYKKGYDIEYLPYLSIENIRYNNSNFDINSSLGFGKVANEDIVSDKVRLDLNLNKKFNINNQSEVNLYGKLKANYYMPDGNLNSNKYYNYQLLGISGKTDRNISDKLTVGYKLSYDYSWETGEAYLPEDKEEVSETVSPALNITYRLPEYQSSLDFGVQGSYELNDKEFEDLNIKLSRKFDCYSYYLGYDVIDNEFELGINF